MEVLKRFITYQVAYLYALSGRPGVFSRAGEQVRGARRRPAGTLFIGTLARLGPGRAPWRVLWASA